MHEVKPETDVETLVSDSPFLLLHVDAREVTPGSPSCPRSRAVSVTGRLSDGSSSKAWSCRPPCHSSFLSLGPVRAVSLVVDRVERQTVAQTRKQAWR